MAQKAIGNWKIAISCVIAAVLLALSFTIAVNLSGENSSDGHGAYMQGSSDDEQAAYSSMPAAVSPAPIISDGKLRVDFSVPAANGGLSERLEIRQNGAIIASTDVLSPGDMSVWLDAPDAVPGDATAVVYAFDSSGYGYGSPVELSVSLTSK